MKALGVGFAAGLVVGVLALIAVGGFGLAAGSAHAGAFRAAAAHAPIVAPGPASFPAAGGAGVTCSLPTVAPMLTQPVVVAGQNSTLIVQLSMANGPLGAANPGCLAGAVFLFSGEPVPGATHVVVSGVPHLDLATSALPPGAFPVLVTVNFQLTNGQMVPITTESVLEVMPALPS
jgi:hypothetical protein